MDIGAIILFMMHRLTPKLFLIIEANQVAFWFVVLILDIVIIAKDIAKDKENRKYAAGIVFTVGILYVLSVAHLTTCF